QARHTTRIMVVGPRFIEGPALAAAMLRVLPLRLLKERSNFMDTSSVTTAPARLYALLLKLRPVERGTIMPFSGDLLHGAWLDWIKSAAPEVATMLHDGNKRRLFTCSSLQFPIAEPHMRRAEWNNVHLPLDPEKTYTVRVTLLLGELFALFYD